MPKPKQDLTHAELEAYHTEVIRRARIILARVSKMEFTGSTEDQRLTWAATFYAGLALIAQVAPCSTAVGVMATMYRLAETLSAEESLEQLKQIVMMHSAGTGTVN